LASALNSRSLFVTPGTRQLAARRAPCGATGVGGCVVSRVHDVGGQAGFGPVPLGDDGQPFRHDREARVYALNGVLRGRGLYTPAA